MDNDRNGGRKGGRGGSDVYILELSICYTMLKE